MTKRVNFQTRAGEAHGEIVEPAGTAKAPAVVLIQEYWGVNDHIRSLLDRLSAAGFVAIAPDLYEGKVAKNAEEASAMMQALDWTRAVGCIEGAAKFAREHPRSNGKVGIIGFCMGGALTFASVAQLGEFSAAVPFYGLPPFDKTPWENVRTPIQAHFAQRDPWATVAGGNQIKDKLTSIGKSMELFVYDAEHAFANDTRPEVHNPAAAKQAWDRATTFLHTHLG